MKQVVSVPLRLIAWCAALLLCGSVSSPVYAELFDREQALATLESADAEARRDAVRSLSQVGTMEDVPSLLEALQHDEDARTRELAEGAVWQVWMRSGDSGVDRLLQDGIEQMDAGKMGQAIDAFTRIIEVKPDFAEGWNKRATAYFLIGDYDQSLRDCDEVMKRNPYHFGALSGYGLIYTRRGELERALEYFERALELNPNMRGVEQSIEAIRYRLGKEGKRSI